MSTSNLPTDRSPKDAAPHRDATPPHADGPAPVEHRHTLTLDIRSSDPTAAMYVHDAIEEAVKHVQKPDQESARDKDLTVVEIRVCFPVRVAHSDHMAAPARLDDDEGDPVVLWAEIHRLRAEAKGPNGYETWRDAAVAERMRRVSAERVLKEQPISLPTVARFDSWAVRHENGVKSAWLTDALGQPELYSELNARAQCKGVGDEYSAHLLHVTYTCASAEDAGPIAQVRDDIERVDVIWFGVRPEHGTNLYAGPRPAQAGGMPVSQEPKYGIRDNRLYNRASGQFIPVDEPVFIFRARDIEAAPAIAHYMARFGPSAHRAAIGKRVEHFIEFKQWYPNRMKAPDTELATEQHEGQA